MIKLLPLFILAFVTVSSSAQNVGINGTGSLPDNSAVLDLSSTTKGFLPPRMTLGERNSIPMPATGNIIYQTDNTIGLYVNKGTPSLPNWQLVGPAVPVASPSFFFTSSQAVAGNDYIGMGTSSSAFPRNTSVVPVNCTLTFITFSARGLFINSPTTATVWRQTPGSFSPQPTALSATIGLGYFSSGVGVVAVNAGDLISVRISSSGALPDGVAVSVTYQ